MKTSRLYWRRGARKREFTPWPWCSSRKDRAVWRYAFENDFIVVTINARDFVNLIEDEVHPGLIILREGDLLAIRNGAGSSWHWITF